jgi:hypothetical protein
MRSGVDLMLAVVRDVVADDRGRPVGVCMDPESEFKEKIPA